MLENPYYTDQPNVPYDLDTYRGEGRIEESDDGSSIVVRWESPLEEAVDAQWEAQRKLGSLKLIRRAQVVYGVAAACCFILMLLLWNGPEIYPIITLCLGIFLIAMIILKPIVFRRAVRRLVVNMRGTTGTIDAVVTLDPAGVQHESQDMAWIFRWRSIGEIDVSKSAVYFVRSPAGLIQVPLRVFSDRKALERFLALAQRYTKQRLA